MIHECPEEKIDRLAHELMWGLGYQRPETWGCHWRRNGEVALEASELFDALVAAFDEVYQEAYNQCVRELKR